MANQKELLSVEPLIDETASVRGSTFGRYTEVGPRTAVIESSLDDYSYVVNDCDIIYSRIGKFCSIASHVRLNPGNHPMQRASQAHFTYRASRYFPGEADEQAFFDWRRSFPVTLGHDVWVGHGAIIMPGVDIGTGAVIGAGAVVTKNVEPYAIVVGVPGRLVRRRFADDVCEGLLKLRWWEWEHEALRTALPDFRQLGAGEFIAKYSSG